MNRVGSLDLVCRERIFVFQYTACGYRVRMRLRLGNERGRGGGRVVCGEDPRWTVGAKEQRRTRVDESLPVRRYIRLLRNGLLEIRYTLLRRNRDLELQLAWACIRTWCAQSVGAKDGPIAAGSEHAATDEERTFDVNNDLVRRRGRRGVCGGGVGHGGGRERRVAGRCRGALAMTTVCGPAVSRAITPAHPFRVARGCDDIGLETGRKHSVVVTYSMNGIRLEDTPRTTSRDTAAITRSSLYAHIYRSFPQLGLCSPIQHPPLHLASLSSSHTILDQRPHRPGPYAPPMHAALPLASQRWAQRSLGCTR